MIKKDQVFESGKQVGKLTLMGCFILKIGHKMMLFRRKNFVLKYF